MEFLPTSYLRYTTLIICTFLLTAALHAQVYVNHAATGANNGSSWADAYTELQPALDAAVSSQEILIAEGTYKPTESPDGTTANSRDRAFHIKTDVVVKGGYDPTTGMQNGGATILSGDLGASGSITDNAYHVLIIKDFFGSSPTIDNITIQDGNANGTGSITFVGASFSRGTGGGILNSSGSSETLSNCIFASNYAITGAGMHNVASPTLTDCTFMLNEATSGGGGIYNNTNSNPILTACVFKQNIGVSGGGMYNSTNSTPTLTNCIFESNEAFEKGGGMYNLNATVTLISSHFYDNEAAFVGGGVYNESSIATLTNCAFTGNFAGNNTGGIHNFSSSTATLTNCTFTRNYANLAGGAIFNQSSSSSIVKNCILWGNDADETTFSSEIANFQSSSATVSYSIVEGGWANCSNCPSGLGDVDPLLINILDPDGIDNIFSTADDGLNLMIQSQAINAGTKSGAPTVDILGTDRVGNPDIGAYEPETCNGNLIFVNFSAMGNNAGTSWENAFIDFQDALDRAQNCGIDSILVAEGTYKPTSSPDESSTNPRDKSFHLNYDVVIEGGYDPSTGTLTGSATILSGDIGDANDETDNVYHVMVNTGLTSAAVFEGLTFRAGNANETGTISYGGQIFDRRFGGGIYLKFSDPIYSNCVFVNNTATINGGGLYITSSDATVSDCLISSNSAHNGGGIGHVFSSSSTILNSIFKSNVALSAGGGIANLTSSESTVTNCVFIGNSAVYGGGIANTGTSTDILNCTLTANSAGSIYAPSITSIINSISWDNGSEITGSSATVSNSIIQDGYTPCTNCPNTDGNIDPLFVAAADPDGLDDIIGTADDGISLGIGSQAINTGNPAGAPSEDVTGATRVQIIDIGAYEARCQNQVIYVNVNAVGNGNGSSWANAYVNVQDALDQVMICGVDSILIAEGTYYPSSSPDNVSIDPRDRAFHLNSDVVVEGGYDPSTGTQTGSATILSGDIGSVSDPADNVYHVMVNTGLTSATVFEGLTCSDGNANGTGNMSYGGTTFDRRYGGGIYNKSSDPIYANCEFSNNNATVNGGGLYITSSDAIVNDCLFSSNSAVNGGGLGNAFSSSSIISRSIFDSNMASATGGGMANVASSQSTLTNCVFIDNSAIDGGGIANTGTSTDIINCTLTANSASNSAGSIFASSTTNITNTNSWGNGSEITASSAAVSNSIIEDGYTPCTNCPDTNGDIDPLFINMADPDGPDNILGTADDGITLGVASPAVNTGNPTGAPSEDITGASRIGIVDIGAYETLCRTELIYVNVNAVGNGNGYSWTDAFTDLQFALDLAMICGVDSILVAEGTYYPTSSPDESLTNPRDRAFHINNDVVVIGGYNPSTGTKTGSATILSGDIGASNDASDNVYHVMVNTGLTSATVFEDLTFRNGNANGSGDNDLLYGGTTFDRRFGGGIYNKSSDPIYSNCVFTNNNATVNGGGLYITVSDATVNDCLFTLNTADSGGGLGNSSSSTSLISRSIFDSNTALLSGGGIANALSSQATITNSAFVNNSADDGGGIANSGTSTDIVNCTLTANSASNSAGSIFASSTTNITNTISWGNGSEITASAASVSNSIIEGGYTGCVDCPNTDGNIDPLFVDAADSDGPDNILGTADDGINLMILSQAINNGSAVGAPLIDITGTDREGNPDIGAYEAETCHDNLVFVSAIATGNNTGSSWENAFIDLQVALDQALDCGVDSILIAEGTYYPTSSPDEVSTDPRDIAFHINNDVVIEGGYDPGTGTKTGSSTILSGDIGASNDASDNVYHVMVNTGLTPAAVFEGLTFRDGNANGNGANDISFGETTFDRCYGGGIYNKSSDPIYSNCVFVNNTATINGGGLYITSSDATITDCLLSSNSADNGGGIGHAFSSSSTILNSLFKSNVALSTGGGIANLASSEITLTNCVFIDNSAVDGGGIANSGTSIDIINSTFTTNSASNTGGSIFVSSTTNITNTILWGNGSEIAGSLTTVSNSIIEGGYSGCNDCPNSNGNKDPLFINVADPDGPDNILGTTDDGISLRVISKGLNAGSTVGAPSIDITGADRVADPDIGAYEVFCQESIRLYVNVNATGDKNGSSWIDAYTDLQDALDHLMICTVDSILVAEGTYYPTSSPDESTENPRNRAFHLNANVVLEGGYDPSTGTQTGGETILSGDLVTAGVTTSDSAYHVMVTVGLDETSVFDNFTFRDGNANGVDPFLNVVTFGGTGFFSDRGGAFFNYSSHRMNNCTFANSTAIFLGGGLYDQGEIQLTNCSFTNNHAYSGGGMYADSSFPRELTNCTFTSNSADMGDGGALHVNITFIKLMNCTFTSNTSQKGGGIYSTASNLEMTNCTFTSNSATINGGGIYSAGAPSTMTDCTFVDNSAPNGGGMRISNSSCVMTNCIFTSNSATFGGGILNGFGSPTLTDCTFTSNAATFGGGIYNYNNGSPQIATGIFTDNTATNSGGGIFNFDNSPATLTTSIFTDNSAPNGGGITNHNSTATLTDCKFYVPESNIGILNETGGTTTITGTVEIINNYVSDIEGNAYKTVKIGNQVWMAENLNLGTMINGMENQTDNATTEKYCYDNDPANCDIYGGLYQWDEMMQYVTTEGTQGVCPIGWHLPTDDELKTLEIELGMTQAEADMTDARGADQGSQLAGNEPLWNNGALVLNAAFGTSGFVALPGGFRRTSGPWFGNQPFSAYLWSSSDIGNVAAYRQLLKIETSVFRSFTGKSQGFSVRCVKD